MKYDAKQIKKARMLKGMSQADVARALKMSPGLISNVEAGEVNFAPTIKAIADLLGLSMEDLLIDDEEDEPSLERRPA